MRKFLVTWQTQNPRVATWGARQDWSPQESAEEPGVKFWQVMVTGDGENASPAILGEALISRGRTQCTIAELEWETASELPKFKMTADRFIEGLKSIEADEPEMSDEQIANQAIQQALYAIIQGARLYMDASGTSGTIQGLGMRDPATGTPRWFGIVIYEAPTEARRDRFTSAIGPAFQIVLEELGEIPKGAQVYSERRDADEPINGDSEPDEG